MSDFAQTGYDKQALMELLDVDKPTKDNKTQVCCLLSRYDYPQELAILACDVAAGWGYSPEMLQSECRDIWLSGFNPNTPDDIIGSGNDTQSA